MQIKTMTYQRVKNLGNFESERLEMFAELNEQDDPIDVADELRKMVNDLLFPVEPFFQVEPKTPSDGF